MISITSGKVLDSNGRIVAYGFDDFVKDICKGNRCFICGADPESKIFNDEHIIPKWLLRHAGLFSKHIVLPNTTKLRYDKYTLPCCAECNSFYGTNLEEKVRPLLTLSYTEFKESLTDELIQTLYLWIAFVFLKTHLKDTLLRLFQDKRKGEAFIASRYNFGWLHHIHALIRSMYTGAKIESGCIGTFIALHAEESEDTVTYDYRDVNGMNTIMIRVGEIALLASLDDGKLSTRFLHQHLSEVSGKPMSAIQLREMLAHLTYVRGSLVELPTFRTQYDSEACELSIKSKLPETVALHSHPPETYGAILHLCTFDLLPEDEKTLALVRTGKVGFIFDEKGRFVRNGSHESHEGTLLRF